MICCLCGHRFLVGEVAVQVTQVRLVRLTVSGHEKFVPDKMEDGSSFKVACLTCPVRAGAPLALIGADGRSDV